MDVQDHKKNALSEQETHSVQLCHKCGWPFPNPHPSAKHRRAHKRVCGTVEGYKVLDSGSDHSNFASSDNEHVSDDDRRNPSPKRSIKASANSGGMGLKSNQSEDELFSDEITEFSNNRANPSLDKNVGGGGEVFHDLKDSHVSKDEKTAGTSQPPRGLAELLQGSIKVGEMSDCAVRRGETNQSETTNSISDIGNEKVLDAVSSRPGLESNYSLAISELIVVSESFHGTSELIVVADNNKTDRETGKRSSSLEPCIKDNEKGDEANEDVHCTTTTEVLQLDRKLEIEPTSGPLELEATTTKVEKETLDPQVQSDSQFKLNNVNAETSHARIVDETANQEEVLANDLQFKHDASSRTKHQELRDALSVSEVESDSPKQSIHCIPVLSNEVLYMEEAGNESTPFLSPAETFPTEENSRVMIGDFKDREMLKSGSSSDFQAGEEERSSENDKMIPILEIFQDALSNLPDGSVDWPSSNPSESKVEKQHVSTPDTGTFSISTTQHLPSTTANVFAGTIDELKENSGSTIVDAEVGTAVPNLPSAQSSVHAENVAYSSVKVSNLQNSQNAVSNVSAGTVDNSTSDTFNGDLDKAGVSTPIDRESGMAVPENLSSVPYRTEGNSSLDALQDDLKNVRTSTLIGGDTSVTANNLCPSSSMSIGTSDEFLLDALKDNLKKDGVSTSVSVEFIAPVPPLATEDSKVPAGTLEHITSEPMDDDLKSHSVSIPINGDTNTSLQGNLPITNSSVLVGAVDRSASELVADDLRKEVVSASNDEEAGASAHEDLKGSLSNIPVVGSSDNILSEALEDDHEEGFSTLHDRDVGRSDFDNLPCVLSSVPAGTTDNSSKEASKDALTKEGVLIHNFVEIGSNIPVVGSSDNISSEALKDSDEEEGFSTLHDRDVGRSDLDNLPRVHSSVPAGTTDNSSNEASKDALTKEGVLTHNFVEVGSNIPIFGSSDNILSEALENNHEGEGFSTLHDRDVGRSDLDNLPCVLSSVPAGTTDNSSKEASKDALTKDSVLTHNVVEVGSNIPVVGSSDNILSEALENNHEGEGFSTLHDRDVGRSDLDNLPCVLSSVPAGTTDNSSKEASKDALTKDGVLTHNVVEVSSNIPVVGSSDNILSEALENDHEGEGFSTLHDRDVGRTDLDNLPCVLSSVPAGITDNSSKDAVTKEGVLMHDFVEVGSSGFRETSGEDNQLLLFAATLPSVKNPAEAMIGDFENHKVLKSNFTFDVGADEEIKLAEDDKKVIVSENPIALKDIPDGNIDNLEDDFKKEGVSIPIDGEVGSFRFMGTSDEESHLLSVADTSATMYNPEALIEEFKDYKVLKSSFSMDFGASEEIISLENDKKVIVSYGVPSESIDSSPSDALKDDLRKDGVSIPIDGEIDASEFKFNNDVDFESSSLGNYLKANSEPNNNAEKSLNRSVDRRSMQNEDLEPASRQESDVVPFESSTGEQNLQMAKLCGGGNASNHGEDKLVYVVSGNENVQPGDEPPASDSTTLARVEAIPETHLLVGNQSLGLENSSSGFSSVADIGTVEVTTEERLANQSHPTYESSRQLLSSDCLDDARNADHLNVETRASGKFCNSSKSSIHTDEILHNSEGLKMGEDTKVSNLSSAPEFVSELKYEDPIQRSEKTPEGSNLKEVAALATESENIRDPAILGPSQDNVDENITKPNPSILAVDNFIVSSRRTDSLEGNWGSVSVLSTQSDVGNVSDAEVVSSTETQAAEKLNDEFKKSEKGKGAAMESHPDKSDVFEAPSFMTLVESKSEAADKKAGWFPSISNVVNESEGRKKNEEIISKVTNWSTAGKQHSPLKNLLNEAHTEAKVKSLSPNAKQLVPAVNNQADETASASKNNGITQTTTTTTTVCSILGSEMPSNADTVKKEIEKEWNSPARYPIQMKKEKRKGKPYWVPFVCCTSMQQDV